jgi:hypothetical protein
MQATSKMHSINNRDCITESPCVRFIPAERFPV